MSGNDQESAILIGAMTILTTSMNEQVKALVALTETMGELAASIESLAASTAALLEDDIAEDEPSGTLDGG